MAQPAAQRRSRAPLLAAIAVGVLSIAAGSLLARAPTPRPGIKITKSAFTVNVLWLNRWAASADGDRRSAAATALAAKFSRSNVTPELERFLNASAEATSSRFGRALMLVKRKLHAALQYLGWGRTDSSGFLRLATLFVASEAQ